MGRRAVVKRSLQLVEVKAATVSDLNFEIPIAGCGSKRKTNIRSHLGFEDGFPEDIQRHALRNELLIDT